MTISFFIFCLVKKDIQDTRQGLCEDAHSKENGNWRCARQLAMT
jgi:hypothetical protein